GGQGAIDADGTAAQIRLPNGIAVDHDGAIYWAESSHTIRKMTTAGHVSTLAGLAESCGFLNATGRAARFCGPGGVTLDTGGNVYVMDNLRLRKITPAGVVTTLAGSGAPGGSDGTGVAAQFRSSGGLAIDSGGNVYLADTASHTIRKVTLGGVVTTLAGLSL